MADFIADRSPRAAAALVSDTFDRVAVLADHPRLGRVYPTSPTDNVRILYLDRLRVVYVVDDALRRVAIMTVRHARQREESLEAALSDDDEG